MNKSFQLWDNFFTLIFPKDSDNLKSLDIGLWEMGAKKKFKRSEQMKKSVKKKLFFCRSIQTHIRTSRIIDWIGLGAESVKKKKLPWCILYNLSFKHILIQRSIMPNKDCWWIFECFFGYGVKSIFSFNYCYVRDCKEAKRPPNIPGLLLVWLNPPCPPFCKEGGFTNILQRWGATKEEVS